MNELRAGVGLGWRAATALLIDRRPGIALSEVVAENVDPAALPRPLAQLVERGLPVIPHGVSLSLGGAQRPDRARLDRLARLAERLRAPLVSEHVAFVRAGGVEAGHLLPLPRTRAMLDVLVENVREAQRALPVPLALENIATLFEWPGAELDEAAFLSELLLRTGAPLLLDVANLYANARNHGFDALAVLDALPLDRIAYVHVAGGVERGGLYHDTHAHPLPDGPLALLAALFERTGPVPVLLERDDRFGTRAALEAELDRIEDVVARSAPRRAPATPALAPETRRAAVAYREELARRQAELVRALVEGAAPPTGFDPARLDAAARVLARKRARSSSEGPRAASRGIARWLRRARAVRRVVS